MNLAKKWIQKVIKKPGALKSYVKRKIGNRAFTSRGTIKVSILKKLAKKAGKIGNRARLALTLRKLKTATQVSKVSWREFVAERMGPYMKKYGGHGPAIRRIAKEWKKLRRK